MMKIRTPKKFGGFFGDPDVKMILVIFAPVFIDMILNTLISTVHSYFVADVGEAAISGIGLVGTINSILIVLFSTLPSAATILVSQYRGAGNMNGARKCVSQSMVMVTLFSVIVMAVMLAFPNQLFDIFFSDVEPDVLREGKTYLRYSALSMPFFGIFQVCACSSRGFGNNKIPLYTSVSGSIVNIIFSFILIIIFDFGVAGAGIGLLVSRIFYTIAICAFFAKNKWYASFSELVHVDWRCLGAIIKLGVLSASESLIVNFGNTMKMRFIVAAGTAHIAANSINGTLFGLCSVPVTAMGTVAITLVGRYIGAGEEREAKNIIKKLLWLTIGMYAIMLIAAIFVFPHLFPLYTDNPETQKLLGKLLVIQVIMTFISTPYVSIITNAFKGAGDATFCTVVSVICMWIVNVGLGTLLASKTFLGLGVVGALISTNASAIAKSFIFLLRYRSGRWLKNKLIV